MSRMTDKFPISKCHVVVGPRPHNSPPPSPPIARVATVLTTTATEGDRVKFMQSKFSILFDPPHQPGSSL